jgi:hypothetical protein
MEFGVSLLDSTYPNSEVTTKGSSTVCSSSFRTSKIPPFVVAVAVAVAVAVVVVVVADPDPPKRPAEDLDEVDEELLLLLVVELGDRELVASDIAPPT